MNAATRNRSAWIRAAAGLAMACAASTPAAGQQEKTTFAEHVRPIFATSCLNCHNADKFKGDLDLTTFKGTMAGGSGGRVISPGNPESSQLFKSVSHTGEPKMPPDGSKLPDAQIELIRRWIAGGCLETSDSKPVAEQPKISLGGGTAGTLPELSRMRLPLVTHAPTQRPGAVLALAAHPGNGVVAVAGQAQVLLYLAETRELVGALPTDDEFVHTLGFTRDGRYLFAGGGVPGKSGRVRIWSLIDGTQVAAVGEELDAVLAADVDVRRGTVALGGPSRVVKIHAVADGSLLQRIVKHTDWVTALAYSPDAVLLATADRAGGVHVWEASSNAPYLSLGGHAAAVRSLDWSPDSNILATAGEDERIKLWDMSDGRLIKEWVAHAGGAMSVRILRDGGVLSAGRDKAVKLWDSNGTLIKQYPAMPEIALSAAADASLENVIGADLDGNVAVWSLKVGAAEGTLPASPPTLAQRLAEASQASDRVALVRGEKRKASQLASQTLTEAVRAAELAKQERLNAEAASAAAEASLSTARNEEQEAKRQAEQATSAAAAASQAADGAAAAVELALAALKSEVDRDSKLQTEMTAAQREQSTLDARAADTARTAAANDTPETRAAADAAGATARAGQERIVALQLAADESSKKVRASLDGSEQAKSACAAAIASRDAARSAADRASAIVPAAAGRVKATEQSLAEAKAAIDRARALETERTGAIDRAKVVAQDSAIALEAASRAARQCERIVARCRAGELRIALDAAMTRLAALEAEAAPLLRAAASSNDAMVAARHELGSLEEQLATAGQRMESRRAAVEQASLAATAAAALAEQTSASAAQRGAELDSLIAIATTLRARAAESPSDAALGLAASKSAEAADSLRASVEAARHAAGEAVAASQRATDSLAAARRSIDDEVAHQAELPALIATARDKLKLATGSCAADRAAAESRAVPIEDARAEVEAIEIDYEASADAADGR
jgi:WD40 repeat protein